MPVIIIKTSDIAGILLIVAGVMLSPHGLVEFLRGVPVEKINASFADQLLMGAQLFRVSLVLLGLAIFFLARLPGWTANRVGVPGQRLEARDQYPFAIIGIVVIAIVLRLYDLENGLWVDEMMTYAKYATQPFGWLVSTYDSQNHHILYSLFAHASFLIIGESAWSLRLPATLFGVGSIITLYIIAQQLASRREALLSAALLTFSYHHVWFSQNARGYTALLFFTLFSSWLLVRGLREKWLYLWASYAVIAALGVYVHMTMLFVIVGHFLVFLWQRSLAESGQWHETTSEFLVGFCLAGLFTLVLYSLVLPQLIGGTYLEGVKDTIETWRNPLWTLLQLIKGLQIGFTGSIAAVSACIIFLTGLVKFIKTESIVVMLLVAPIVVTIVVIMGLGHSMFPRTFFFAIGFCVLIVIRGTLALGDTLVQATGLLLRNPTILGTIMCLGMIGVSALSIPRVYAPKQDYSSALEFVEQNYSTGDVILTLGVAAIAYKQFYGVDWSVVKDPQKLDNLRFAHKRTWLLYTMPLHMESAYPEIMSIIKRDFAIAKQFPGTLGDGTIFVAVSELPPT